MNDGEVKLSRTKCFVLRELGFSGNPAYSKLHLETWLTAISWFEALQHGQVAESLEDLGSVLLIRL